jgi:hypothetical protein
VNGVRESTVLYNGERFFDPACAPQGAISFRSRCEIQAFHFNVGNQPIAVFYRNLEQGFYFLHNHAF